VHFFAVFEIKIIPYVKIIVNHVQAKDKFAPQKHNDAPQKHNDAPQKHNDLFEISKNSTKT
tara:strand:- start:639 stop:821 length:183 start_codon:yes stop_codon:yes gene_type:complete